MRHDVVIIGGGLGGLETGYILAKNGLDVCVLEQGLVLGGCLQTFKRKGMTFDTGYHYIGGLDEGQSLHRIFSSFGLMDLPWEKMDEDFFDEVVISGESYRFANGYDRFVETLSAAFPHQQQNLRKYVDFLKTVGQNIFNQFKPKDTDSFYSASLFGRSAYDFLRETITDDRLISVLSGTSLKMELSKSSLPLYTFAQINDSFIQSAYRIRGGGDQICLKLAKQITAMGGTVRTKCKVVDLVEEKGLLTRAVLESGEEISAKWFISSVHPAITLDLVHQSEKLRKVYRNRIARLANTYGMFTANIKFKPDTVPYIGRNQYIYDTEDVWSVADDTSKVKAALVSYVVPEQKSDYALNLDILTPMHWSAVEQWDGTAPMRRGTDYEAMKQQKAEECVDFVSRHIPHLRDAIDTIYTSTPLTYKDYVSTSQGSAYGIRKDCNQVMLTMLSPRTPIDNLLLTGQSLNLHGVLGVSMTSFFTAAEIIGMEQATRDLHL